MDDFCISSLIDKMIVVIILERKKMIIYAMKNEVLAGQLCVCVASKNKRKSLRVNC